VSRFRNAAVLCVALAVAGGCGGDDASPAPSTTTGGVATTVPATTVAAPVRLQVDGLGRVSFGAPADAAVSTLRDALGPPEADTTVNGDMPNGLGGPRTTSRTVRWGQLAVSFVDWSGSPYRSDGTLHMVHWLVTGENSGGRVFATPEGVRIGTGLAEIRQAFGSSLVIERDDCVGAWQIRVGNSSLGLVGRLDAGPENANARLVYLAAGLRSSC
jgi:hypothetical protein